MAIFLPVLFLGLLIQVSAQVPERLPSPVNSPCEEREPILSRDGQTLYFWRKYCSSNPGGSYDEGDIWYTRLDRNGQWGNPRPLDLNTEGQDFVWQVSVRHDTLWLHQDPITPFGTGASFVTRMRIGGDWSRPTPMDIEGFSHSGDYRDFRLTPEGHLLLTNFGENSYGSTDIYFCRRTGANSWGPPMNLGPVINTPGDEDAPFISPDGKILYFNSNGHGGLGGHDIWISRRLDDSWKRWSEPENMGAPVNTPGDDFDFRISEDHKWAYWCHAPSSVKTSDIWRMDLESCEPGIHPNSDQKICAGEPLLLTAGYVSENWMVRYQWYRNGEAILGATDRVLPVSDGGRYHVFRSKGGCRDSSISVQVEIIPAPKVELTASSFTICPGSPVTLKAQGKNLGSIQWLFNGQPIPGASEESYQATRSGRYQVLASNEACQGLSNPVNLTVLTPPAIFTEADSNLEAASKLPGWRWSAQVGDRKMTIQDMAPAIDDGAWVLTERSNNLEARRLSPAGRWIDQVNLGPSNGQRVWIDSDPADALIVAGGQTYLRKILNGKLAWEKKANGYRITGLVVSDDGSIVVSGRIDDELSLEGREVSAPEKGGIFVARHQPDGNLAWLRSFAVDELKSDFGNALATDCEGNLYVAGLYDESADIGIPALRGERGEDNVYIFSLTPEGDLRWTGGYRSYASAFPHGDLEVNCQGEAWLLINSRLVRLDPQGFIIHDEQVAVSGELQSQRLQLRDQDLFIQVQTTGNQRFVIDRSGAGTQHEIWRSDLEKGILSPPVMAADAKGNVFFATNGKGGDQPGRSQDERGAFVNFFGKASPGVERPEVSVCNGESLTLLTDFRPGMQYQWYKDNKPISYATGMAMVVNGPGNYQVEISQGGCALRSLVQEVLPCGQAPSLSTPPPPPLVVSEDQATSKDPPPPPKAAPQPPKPEKTVQPSDLKVSSSGKPKKLKGRGLKKQKKIKVARAEVAVAVWDYAAVDNDTVSVNVNGEWILQDYGLTKFPNRIKCTLKPGKNYIMLYAHNLGAHPPNTATVMVDDGESKQSMVLKSNMKRSAMLIVELE